MKENNEIVYTFDRHAGTGTLQPVKVTEKVGVFVGTQAKDLTDTAPLIFSDMESLKKNLPKVIDLSKWTDSDLPIVIRTFKMVE